MSSDNSDSSVFSPADVTTLLGPSFPWDSAVNQSGASFAKFENSQKIEDKAYDDNFFTVVIRSTRSFFGGAKIIFGVRCTLRKSHQNRSC